MPAIRTATREDEIPRTERLSMRPDGTTSDAEHSTPIRPRTLRAPTSMDREVIHARHDQIRQEFGDMEWVRPTNLDAPKARVGYKQRWVSVAKNESGASAYTMRMREGWRPRDASTIAGDHHLYPRSKMDSAGHDIIQIGSLVLCEMPEQIYRQKRAYVAQMVSRQNTAIDFEARKVSEEGAGRGFGAIERTEKFQRVVGRRPNAAETAGPDDLDTAPSH